jgi:RND family efflux transporter MFP subunit
MSLAAALLAGCNRQAPVQARQDTGPVQVRVAPVLVKEIRRVVESVGTLFPFDEAIISAEVDGRIEAVSVDLGDRVEQGQILVRINDEEQRYLLSQNEAQLRQSLERLGLKSENDRVKDIRETPDVRKAQAELFDAEQRYQRVRKLVDQGIGSQADLDQAAARFKANQAAYDNALNSTRLLIQEVERFKAALELQRKRLRDTTVRAPFPGFVKERQATQGQYVKANTPLLTLVKVDPIRLRIEIPERMAPWIRVGQMVEVAVEAFENRKFQGKIWRISPTVDQTKRTFVAEALIDNPRGELKPGSYARAKVPSDKVEQVKLIPARSINYVLGSNRAYVIKDDVVEAREVKLGERFESLVEVSEGLQEGERVATTQVNRLDSGTRVQVVSGEEEKSSRRKAG